MSFSDCSVVIVSFFFESTCLLEVTLGLEFLDLGVPLFSLLLETLFGHFTLILRFFDACVDFNVNLALTLLLSFFPDRLFLFKWVKIILMAWHPGIVRLFGFIKTIRGLYDSHGIRVHGIHGTADQHHQ